LIVFLKKNRLNIIIIIAFLILPFIVFKNIGNINSVIFGSGDPNNYTIPINQLVTNLIKNHEFPFWNKYIFSGYPLFANPQVNVFYPLNTVIYLLLPLVAAYNLTILLHYSLAGIFMFLFLNSHGLKKISSFAAGIIFMFSGILISHRGHPQMLYTIIWFPLILYLIENYRKSKRFEYILMGGIFYAISLLGGNPQMFLYGSIILLLYILYYSFIYNRNSIYLLFSFSIFIIGFAIISIYLIPIYELSKHSIRADISYGYFIFLSYPPKLLFTLLFPFLYGGGISDISFFGAPSFTETINYFGVSSIPLLIIGFFSKNKHKYLWIFILVFSLILVLGDYTPLYRIMYYIPLYNKFRIPPRNWFQFGMAFSALSGFGFDYLIKVFKNKIKKTLTAIISFFVFVTIFALSINLILRIPLFKNFLLKRINNENLNLLIQSTEITNFSFYIQIIIIVITITLLLILLFKKNKTIYILLILLIIFDLGLFARNGSYSNGEYIFNELNDSKKLEFLQKEENDYRIYVAKSWNSEGIQLKRNKNIHYGIEAISGCDPLVIQDYDDMTDLSNMDSKNLYQFLLKNNNVISMLNTKYIFGFKPENPEIFLDDITKTLYINNDTIISSLDDKDYNCMNSKFSKIENIIKFEQGPCLKSIEIPVQIKAEKNYLISFEIRKFESMDNVVYFDYYGNGYDETSQEFILKPEEITTDFNRIHRDLNSGEVPLGTDIYFRIFTNSNGPLEIRDLEIYEVEIRDYNNYELLLEENNSILLKNNNYLPRFYFVNSIINVENLNEAINIIREKDVIWDCDRFNPKTEATVEKKDFDRDTFKNDSPELEILKYNNDYILLNVKTNSEEFLVFSDCYYPGWKAYIDGSETKIYKTNGIIKGIIIPEGEHKVVFNFKPTNWLALSIISISGFLLTLLAIILLIYKRKKNKY
jgi:hypothetical protein